MLKRAIITALTAGCAVIDALTSSGVPVGPLRRLGCPTGLDLRAARLEERWGLTSPANRPGHRRSGK